MCQVCDHVIEFPNGVRYAEAHHIQPLGASHNGPDIVENIICVCPNHHAELNHGILPIELSALRTAEEHSIDPQYVDYHNKHIHNSKNSCTIWMLKQKR